MKFCVLAVAVVTVAVLGAASESAAAPRPAKEALQPFNDLIGSWKGTGLPAGNREEALRNFWTESIAWQWQFKGKDAWLKVDFAKSKNFTTGTLRYDADKDRFVLTVQTPAKKTLTFAGPLTKRVLMLERTDGGESQRLVFTLLHPNRYLYRYDVRPAGKTLFRKQYQVGATKEGVAFATGDGQPECIVSGGLGTMRVTYRGQTYYVCCGGCRDEFNADPAKYVREYEAKQKAKKR